MKLKKIVVFYLLFIMCITSKVFGKYYYVYEYDVADFTREVSNLNCNVSYSQTEWTNQDVTVFIISNNELEPVSNFVLSDDKKTLSKIVSQNESGTIEIHDLAGNTQEVSYNVENIDKTLPQIIGCENNKQYTAPLNLDYTDNIEIDEVYIDKYDNELSIRYIDYFHDDAYYYGIDKTKSTVKIYIKSHPVNTRKYLLYLDGNYYASTTEKEFVYTGLEKGKNYKIKVVAVDENGKILAESSIDAKTSYYGKLTSEKNDTTFSCKFSGIEDIGYIRFILWNNGNESKKYSYDIYGENDEINFSFDRFANVTNPKYTIHAYIFDSNGNYVDIIGMATNFNVERFVQESEEIDPYCLDKAGNYQILVTDVAGNEIIYYIKIN